MGYPLENFYGSCLFFGIVWDERILIFGEIDILKSRDDWGHRDTVAIVTARVDKGC